MEAKTKKIGDDVEKNADEVTDQNLRSKSDQESAISAWRQEVKHTIEEVAKDTANNKINDLPEMTDNKPDDMNVTTKTKEEKGVDKVTIKKEGVLLAVPSHRRFASSAGTGKATELMKRIKKKTSSVNKAGSDHDRAEDGVNHGGTSGEESNKGSDKNTGNSNDNGDEV